VIERPPNQSTGICVFGCFDAHAVAVQRAAARREKTDAKSQTSEKNDTVAAVQIPYGMLHLRFVRQEYRRGHMAHQQSSHMACQPNAGTQLSRLQPPIQML
jgi:hypothetical protein